jgi:hypothetical protein
MQTYQEIQAQVGAWSVANFGRQETPHLNAFQRGTMLHDTARAKGDAPGRTLGPVAVALDGLAPLMGIMEEVGELFGSKEPADRNDAIGDIAVYLCDYCCRECIQWPIRIELTPVEKMDPVTGLVVYLGRLYWCHLKRLQRIRGMHQPVIFRSARLGALHGFIWHLEEMAREESNTDLLTLLNKTWNNVVKKRDWNANAANGGGHTHNAGVTPE